MKRIFVVMALGFLAISLTGCRETEKETVIIEKETTTQDSEGILERTAKKVDGEVNKEIDKTIDEIGDDN